MYSATVRITIPPGGFTPACYKGGESPSINAVLGPPQDISPGPEPAGGVFHQEDTTIVITIPPGYPGSVQLIYQLPDPNYVLLGAAFYGAGPKPGAGRLEFRSIELDRDTLGSQMTVTDSCLDQFNYQVFKYVILVQEVSSGNIGIIDPDVETETSEPP